MECTPDTLTPVERYKLLIGSITPRPIALVSTVDDHGRTNLAPFSFFSGLGTDPMTVLFCPANNPDGSEKDTLRNCKPQAEGGTGQFVVAIATEQYAQRMAAAAEPLPPEQSEFDLSGLTPAHSAAVRPPRVAQSPINIECETMQVIRTNPGKPGGGNLVIGQVVHITISDELLNERKHIDQAKTNTIGRMGGMLYCTTNNLFEMPNGRAALDAI